jgi:hypothetical protein
MSPVKLKKFTLWRRNNARKQQQDRLDGIYRTIEENPGEKAGFLARLLGLKLSSNKGGDFAIALAHKRK